MTIILLMRALDPLGYEKETLAHFQKLKVIDRLTLSLTHTHTHTHMHKDTPRRTITHMGQDVLQPGLLNKTRRRRPAEERKRGMR